MREIILTQGEVALVDDADYEYLNQWKWQATSTKGRSATRYARRSNTFRVNGKRANILMHRVIMQAPSGLEVDHDDRNGLNNQRANLKIVTGHENALNRHIHKDIRYIGVTRKGNRFQAQINLQGKVKYLGVFVTPEDAARAYDATALQEHGATAYCNFPPEAI